MISPLTQLLAKYWPGYCFGQFSCLTAHCCPHIYIFHYSGPKQIDLYYFDTLRATMSYRNLLRCVLVFEPKVCHLVEGRISAVKWVVKKKIKVMKRILRS